MHDSESGQQLPPKEPGTRVPFLGLAASFSAPVIAGYAILVATGYLEWQPGLVAAMVTVFILTALARQFMVGQVQIRNYLESLIRSNSDEEDPRVVETSLIAPGLDSTLGSLTRSLQDRRGAVSELEAANTLIVNTLPHPLFMLAGDMSIVRTNRAAERIFGKNLKGRNLADILPVPEVLEMAEKAVDKHKRSEIDFVLPGLFRKDYRALTSSTRGLSPEGAKLLLMLDDITSLKNAARARADFITNASHEIKTPLTSVNGLIETLLGPAKDDEKAREQFLSLAHSEARRMMALIDDLLSLSRVEMNAHAAPDETVNLRTLTNQVMDNVRLTIEKRKSSVTIDMEDGLPDMTGDAMELERALGNLVENALKYSPEESAITVYVHTCNRNLPGLNKPTDFIEIGVRDQGPGIDPEHIPRLTERFYRVDKARSREMGGTGLGLAIVKHIAQRHRGMLHIDSTPGEGSQFTLVLPIRQQEHEKSR